MYAVDSDDWNRLIVDYMSALQWLMIVCCWFEWLYTNDCWLHALRRTIFDCKLMSRIVVIEWLLTGSSESDTPSYLRHGELSKVFMRMNGFGLRHHTDFASPATTMVAFLLIAKFLLMKNSLPWKVSLVVKSSNKRFVVVEDYLILGINILLIRRSFVGHRISINNFWLKKKTLCQLTDSNQWELFC